MKLGALRLMFSKSNSPVWLTRKRPPLPQVAVTVGLRAAAPLVKS